MRLFIGLMLLAAYALLSGCSAFEAVGDGFVWLFTSPNGDSPAEAAGKLAEPFLGPAGTIVTTVLGATTALVTGIWGKKKLAARKAAKEAAKEAAASSPTDSA